MRILVTGGCGYIGSRLIPFLLADGHSVTVFDAMYFGDGFLPDNPKLTLIKGDIRDAQAVKDASLGQDVVIWLASVSNNDMYKVNYDVVHEINTTLHPYSQFIYASSVAVLDPTSDYAKDKLTCEKSLDGTGAIIVRAASVCGYSSRQRFDLTLNMMTHDAYRKGVITVFGGEQNRSHVHIDDLCDFYRLVVKKGVSGETYTVWNIGLKIKHAAQDIQNIFEAHKRPISIRYEPRADNRDWPTLNGDSMRSIGAENKRAVWDGVRDLIHKFDAGYWKDSLENSIYQNTLPSIE